MFGIFVERQVGIGSAAAAIEPHLRSRPDVRWTDVTYVEAGGLVERLPLPGRAGGTLRGFLQTRRGLGQGPFAAQLFLTHNPAVFQPRALRSTPTLLWTDVTPALLDEQADHYNHPRDRFAALSRVKHELVRATFRRAAYCVGWSHWARASFETAYGVPREMTRVVPPGIELERWARAGAPANHPPRLLFVGGDFVRKGGDLLLDVYREHLRGRCELDLVTRDPVAEEPGVRVHHGLSAGSEPLRRLYASASALVLPTRGDCFSIAALEAMAASLPVVITRVGGIPDIVEHEQSGFLVDPGDGAALRASLEALLDDPARAAALGARGRALAEQRFDARRTAGSLLALLQELAGRSAAAVQRGG